MPSRTDHDRRDAQDAAYATIVLHMRPYIRRMTEEARAHIEQEAAEYDGSDPVDWTAVGEAAAYSALTKQGVILPQRKLDAIQATLKAGGAPALEQKNP